MLHVPAPGSPTPSHPLHAFLQPFTAQLKSCLFKYQITVTIAILPAGDSTTLDGYHRVGANEWKVRKLIALWLGYL